MEWKAKDIAPLFSGKKLLDRPSTSITWIWQKGILFLRTTLNSWFWRVSIVFDLTYKIIHDAFVKWANVKEEDSVDPSPALGLVRVEGRFAARGPVFIDQVAHYRPAEKTCFICIFTFRKCMHTVEILRYQIWFHEKTSKTCVWKYSLARAWAHQVRAVITFWLFWLAIVYFITNLIT